jgi:hypothetical protein
MTGPGFFYALGSARKKLQPADDGNPGRNSEKLLVAGIIPGQAAAAHEHADPAGLGNTF